MIRQTMNKPLPEVTDLTRPFWSAAREGRLVAQKCPRCGACDFPPKPWCVECGCRELQWQALAGAGTVYSYSVATAVMMNLPGWKSELPFILCLIDLDDGPRMYAQLTDCTPEHVRIGMRVTVRFERMDDEVSMPKFKPA